MTNDREFTLTMSDARFYYFGSYTLQSFIGRYAYPACR